MKCFWIWIGLVCFTACGCSARKPSVVAGPFSGKSHPTFGEQPLHSQSDRENVKTVQPLKLNHLVDKTISTRESKPRPSISSISANSHSENQEISLASFAQQSGFDDEKKTKNESNESSRRTNEQLKEEDYKNDTSEKTRRKLETDARLPFADDSLTDNTPAPASDSSESNSYSLKDIEQWALSHNPALSAAHAAICKAQGLQHQVGIRPNPTLGISSQQLADAGTDQHLIFLEREFVRGDKLRLNREVLSQTTAAQQRELETQQKRVLTDVRVLFYEAIAAQYQVEAARQLQATATRGVEIARDRLKAEEGTRIEVLQSETLLSEITLSVERTEIAYRAAWKELAAIAGLPPAVPIHLVGELASNKTDLDWDAVYEQIVLQSPELSTARAIVCEKSALVRRQQVQAIPNVTGQLGAGYDNGTSSGMINAQLSAPIPTVNKNHGNISAANADYQLALENVRRIEQSIKSRLARVAQDYESALASVNKYEAEIIPQSTTSLELSETAYKAGELDFLQVLILRRSYFESSIRLIESKSQLAQAQAKIEGMLLSGALSAPQDYTDGDGIRGASFDGQ